MKSCPEIRRTGNYFIEPPARDLITLLFYAHAQTPRLVEGQPCDEEDDNYDEALCATDFNRGGFVIDDDLADIFVGLGEG